jgi:hypothetical protein
VGPEGLDGRNPRVDVVVSRSGRGRQTVARVLLLSAINREHQSRESCDSTTEEPEHLTHLLVATVEVRLGPRKAVGG